MIVGKLESEKRKEKPLDKPNGIILNGKKNDYPNKIKEIAEGSGTAMNCLDRYRDFLIGDGFVDQSIGNIIVNEKKRLTVINILRAVIEDYTLQNAVTLHCNYNLNADISDITPIEYETARLCEADDTGYISQVALNPCWPEGKKDKIKRLFIHNFDKRFIYEQIKKVGGIKKYRGQVYWWSKRGLDYPASIIDPIATDCVSEEGCANVKKRNVKNNFLPSGVLITYGKQEGKQMQMDKDINPMDKEALRLSGIQTDFEGGESIEDTLIEYQGDSEACKMMSIRIGFKEEKPEFIPFPTTNFDKEFEYTETSSQANIGKRFNQPGILRCELVAGKLGSSTEIADAYNYYNSVLKPKRAEISEIMKEVLSHFNPLVFDFTNKDFTIKPLSYIP